MAVAPKDVPAGPVKSEYEQRGGSVVFLSACLDGGAGGYAWRAPARPVVTAAAVRARAVRLIPGAALGLAPKTSTLVHIQTVLWVAAPQRQQLPVVRILGQQVRIALAINHVAYGFGDGSSDASGPRGKAYDASGDPCRTRLCPDYYGHVYQRTGTMRLQATAYWSATFTVDGGRVQRVPGTVPGPAATATVHVKQARAVLVP